MTTPRSWPQPAAIVPSRILQGGDWRAGERLVAEETAVAVTYNRITHAVMMASPTDLEDFAAGFSLSEEIVAEAGEIEELELVAGDADAVECRMWIAPDRMEALERRRRRIAGATGCGMCGLESLQEALRQVPTVQGGATISGNALQRAVASLAPAQSLNRQTRAVHAAGLWTEAGGLVALREDVGRHNALDKLAGALARSGRHASQGVVVLTSRLSVELVQKAARMGAPLVIAVSAPTALALRTAESAGITLAGIARGDGFELFTHPWRVTA